ncbi:VOC family protein [Salipaludibacillus agaradhaerens]|uniref:VOC family protein n=1 Tax=Salipaludibacillus agaradhaerens TaxID=76935 RepID=UPI00215072A3|nr:VOC family protein [Salipaludibacillus agaradhaerens]MCR6105135.1 VOC family protein [Salipaludibacillus agaradhaerens]MCR6117180.1 VOC family protein [Salipaludibacillus agaradhaerens]
MIKAVLQCTLFVHDQQEAKVFYTEKLGFVVRADEEFSPGWRYVTVSPTEDNKTVLEFVQAETPEEKSLIGKQANSQVMLMFETDNIEEDFANMKARGIIFHGVPQSVPGGKGVGFEDLYGNKLDIFEPEKRRAYR